MKKFLCALPLLILFFFAQAQAQTRKELTLHDAIMEQSRLLSPDDISGVKWISPTEFVHSGGDGVLLFRNLKGDTLKTLTTEILNNSLAALDVDPVSSISPYGWKNANEFYLRCGGDLLLFNTLNNTATNFLHFPSDAKNLEFSKNSGNVAYTIGNDVYIATAADSAIRVTNHEGTEISAGVAIHRSEFGITKGLFWAEDGQKLGFYEMDESMVTDYPLVDYNPYPAKVNLIKYPMAGQTSHQARVGIFDLKSQKTTYLKTGKPLDHYLTNFTFSPEGKWAYLAELNRDQNDMNLNVYDVQTGDKSKTLFNEKDEKYVEPQHSAYFPKADGKTFLWFSFRDGFNHLYLYDNDGKIIRKVTDGDFDILSIDGQSEDGNTLVVTAVDGLMDRAIYAVDINKGKMRKLTTDPGTYRVNMGKGDHFIEHYNSPKTGNEVSVVNLKGTEMSRLLTAKNPLKDYAIGKLEFPVITAKDGTKLQARLIKPVDFDPSKKYPVIVYLYNGPHVQLVRDDYKGGAAMWMYEAANRGYIVFTVDGRGSGNRGLAFEQVTFRQLGTVEMEDQLAGVDYLKSLPYVNSEKMAVHGWSFGGFMATSLMLRYPGVFKVGVAGGPVTDWRLYEIMYTERYMDTPQQNPEGYETADLKNYVQNLDGDLLMIHGLDDNTVVPQHAFTLIKAFVDAKVQTDFFTYPGHEHNVRGIDRVHLMTKVLDYIDLHLEDINE